MCDGRLTPDQRAELEARIAHADAEPALVDLREVRAAELRDIFALLGPAELLALRDHLAVIVALPAEEASLRLARLLAVVRRYALDPGGAGPH